MWQRMAAFVLLILTNTSLAGAISFNTALPVAQNYFVLRELGIYKSITDDPSSLGRERIDWASQSVLAYGIHPNWTVFAVVPFVEHKLEQSGTKREASGLGDMAAFLRWSFAVYNWVGQQWRTAVFLGEKFPTGEDDDHDSRGRLPRKLQAGSGSWDTFGGLVSTYQTLSDEIDGQVSYRYNTEASGFQFGDAVDVDASWQHRLWPRQLGEGVPHFLYTVFEANFEYRSHNEKNGATQPNSGGKRLWLDPGLQYVTKQWVIEALFRYPVWQELNGTALEADWVVMGGFRVNLGL